jgi:hypothetical protein
MPGGVTFSLARWAFGPAYSGGNDKSFQGLWICDMRLNDSLINFTCEVRGAHMRRPA